MLLLLLSAAAAEGTEIKPVPSTPTDLTCAHENTREYVYYENPDYIYLNSQSHKVVGYDADNTRRDVIFRKPLAECQHTNEDLASGWAAKKIIHLLADKTISINPTEKRLYESEIRKLSSIYGLAIPY